MVVWSLPADEDKMVETLRTIGLDLLDKRPAREMGDGEEVTMVGKHSISDGLEMTAPGSVPWLCECKFLYPNGKGKAV